MIRTADKKRISRRAAVAAVCLAALIVCLALSVAAAKLLYRPSVADGRIFVSESAVPAMAEALRAAGISADDSACAALSLSAGPVIIPAPEAAAVAGSGSYSAVSVCSAAAVICADRDRTKEPLSGWSDIRKTSSVIYIDEYAGYKLAAAAYTPGEGFDIDEATELFSAAGLDGRITLDPDEADILVCFDYEAEYLRRRGRNIETVFPAEGTVAFDLCLVSRGSGPDAGEISKALCGSGFRPAGYEYPGAYRPSDDEYRTIYDRPGTLYDYFAVNGSHRREWYRFSGAEQNLLIRALLTAAVFLCGFAVYCSCERRMKLALVAETALIVGWCVVRMIKWMSPASVRILWYLFYFFIGGLLLVFMHISADAAGMKRYDRRVIAAATVVDILIFALVLTNDLHMLVFRFDPGTFTEYEGPYSYGPVFVVIFVMYLTQALYSAGKLIQNAVKSPVKKSSAIPVVLLAAAVAYCVLYAAGIRLLSNDITFVACAFWIAMTAAVIVGGLVPVNIGYKGFFTAAPMPMEIRNSSGYTELRSGAAGTPPGQLLDQIRESGVAVSGDSLWRTDRINGGTVIWGSDIGVINALRRATAEKSERLAAANLILVSLEESSRRRLSADSAKKISDELDGLLSDRLGMINSLAVKLKNGENTAPELALIICSVKRISNFFFLSREPGRTITVSELTVYLSELCDICGWKKIRAAASRSGDAALRCENASMLYELASDALISMPQGSGALISLVCGEYVTLNITSGASMKAAENRISRAGALGITVSVAETEDICGLTARSPVYREDAP